MKSKKTMSKIEKEAMEKTLQAYEKLFKNPKDKILKWIHYGSVSSCNLCRIFRLPNKTLFAPCNECILNDLTENDRCCTNYYKEMLEIRDDFYESEMSRAEFTKKFTKVAKKRYKEIIKHLNSHDYYWEVR